MTKEELTKVENTLLALLRSLAYYTSWYSARAYWKTKEEYEEFEKDAAEALDIIKKELNNKKDKKLLYANYPFDA